METKIAPAADTKPDAKPEAAETKAGLKSVLQSRTSKRVMVGLLCLAALLLTFAAGMAAGFHKARFSYRWSDNYHRNFAGPKGGFWSETMGHDFTDAHGTFGQVMAIDGQTVTISGRDDIEKLITVTDKTVITRFRDAAKLGDLVVGQYVTIIGSPRDDGNIDARFIRIMPSPDGRHGTPAASGTPDQGSQQPTQQPSR